MTKTSMLAVLLAMACVPAFASAPHPFHSSMAEMEYNAETNRIEVALKLYAVDSEVALTRLGGKPCNLDNEPNRDRLLQTYLASRFRIVEDKETTPKRSSENKGKPLPRAKGKSAFNYVGSEVSGAHLWVYFELQVPKASKQFTLQNDVLLEVQKQQLNVVRFRAGKSQQTQFFNEKNKTRKLTFKNA
ncbi:MAG: DUF6702 family protein [Planctomycetaceae bacterium]